MQQKVPKRSLNFNQRNPCELLIQEQESSRTYSRGSTAFFYFCLVLCAGCSVLGALCSVLVALCSVLFALCTEEGREKSKARSKSKGQEQQPRQGKSKGKVNKTKQGKLHQQGKGRAAGKSSRQEQQAGRSTGEQWSNATEGPQKELEFQPTQSL